MFIVSYVTFFSFFSHLKFKLSKAEFFCTHIEQLTENFKYILVGVKHDTNPSLEERAYLHFMIKQTKAKAQGDYTRRVLP